MDVRCPVCDERVTSEKIDNLSMTLGGHLEARHGVSRQELYGAPVARTPQVTESRDECVTRTFSETECSVQSEESKVLQDQVREWRYPRTGSAGERGPAFLCPVCGVPMAASDEDNLNNELRAHFTEVHQLDKMKMSMKR